MSETEEMLGEKDLLQLHARIMTLEMVIPSILAKLGAKDEVAADMFRRLAALETGLLAEGHLSRDDISEMCRIAREKVGLITT